MKIIFNQLHLQYKNLSKYKLQNLGPFQVFVRIIFICKYKKYVVKIW